MLTAAWRLLQSILPTVGGPVLCLLWPSWFSFFLINRITAKAYIMTLVSSCILYLLHAHKLQRQSGVRSWVRLTSPCPATSASGLRLGLRTPVHRSRRCSRGFPCPCPRKPERVDKLAVPESRPEKKRDVSNGGHVRLETKNRHIYLVDRVGFLLGLRTRAAIRGDGGSRHRRPRGLPHRDHGDTRWVAVAPQGQGIHGWWGWRSLAGTIQVIITIWGSCHGSGEGGGGYILYY